MSHTVIQGTYHNGRVELDDSVDWAEGRRVSVAIAADSLGLRETDWPTSDEQLAKHAKAAPRPFVPLAPVAEKQADFRSRIQRLGIKNWF